MNAAALVALAALAGSEPPDDADLFARLDRLPKDQVLGWFRLTSEQWPVFESEARRLHRVGYEYSPFVEYRHPAASGPTINMSEHGFRPVSDQGPWPPSPDHFVVFLFGGSTAMHFGPDWTGVANRLQTALGAVAGRPVRIYNFGRGAYFSSQEMLLYLDLLRRGRAPDLAIFLDGLNEFYFHDGIPATGDIFRQALRAHVDRGDRRIDDGDLHPIGQACVALWNSLPLPRLIDRLVDLHLRRSAEGPAYRIEPLDAATADRVIQRYLFNRRVIERLSADAGTAAAFVWQPVPGYKYDLAHHVARHPTQGLCGHERSGVGYAMMAERMAADPPGPNFIWLADMQERRAEPLYLDTVHYTADFADLIADRIAEELAARGLLAPRPRSGGEAG